MKRLLWLFLLLPSLALAQQQQIYCDAATTTPCNTTSNAGNGNQGDPFWKAFGKSNANFSTLFTQYNRTPAEIAAGVTPVNYGYPACWLPRYGNNLNGGAVDVSTALNNAISACQGGAITVPYGQYLLNGTATVNVQDVSIQCLGAPPNSNNNYGISGAEFEMTSTSVAPFSLGSGESFTGCSFYWPNQQGASSTPTAYPALFTEQTGKQISNFDLTDDRIVNAYDVLDQSACADAFGNIHLVGTYGYAIRYWFSLCNVPETWTVTGMAADWNLFQNVANASPNYYLVKWTAQNGAFLHVFGNGNGTTTASTYGVGGLIFSGSVFAYNKFIWVDDTGNFNESSLSGIVDAVPHILEVDSGGCIGEVALSAQYYSYTWNPPSGGTGGTDNAPAFSITTPSSGFTGCTATNVDIGGTINNAQGDVLDLSGTYIKTVSLHLKGNGKYAASSTAATYYFANINGSNVIFDAFGNHIEPSATGSSYKGINIQSCYQCTITGNSFNGVYAPITLTSAGSFSAQGNAATATPTGGALVGPGLYVWLSGNYWDANAMPSPTVGTLPTCNSVTNRKSSFVTDATSPTYNGALTGGGAVVVPVFCNGTAWTSH